MSDMTNYLREALADHIFNGITYIAPSGLYLALYTTAPTASGGGTEVAGGSYVRPLLSWGPTGEPGEQENEMVQIENMPQADVVAVGITDSETGGNLLFFKGGFGTISLLPGDTYAAVAGAIKIKIV